jgi:uncharacterized BrkB/YihY/UPF0761 family membrane protein
MLVVLVLLVVGSSIWVFFDAQGRDFSENNTARGPYAWAFAVLLLWIFFFPAYLAQRSRHPIGRDDE